MKIVVAQHNESLWLEHKLNFGFFYHVYYMNINKAVCRKKSFRHVVLNNLRNGPRVTMIALIACANFSIETKVYSQNYKY